MVTLCCVVPQSVGMLTPVMARLGDDQPVSSSERDATPRSFAFEQVSNSFQDKYPRES